MDEGAPATLAIALHPGLILRDELAVLGVSMAALARALDVPPGRISEIVAGRRAITGDTALRLGHWFGTSPQFWLNLQVHYDLTQAARALGPAIDRLPTRADVAA
jgi:addiction module HigA family antidote